MIMTGVTIFRSARHRFVQQTEVSECGLACLAMVADYHGLKIDITTLRQTHVSSLRGTSLKGLIRIADSLGLESTAIKLPLEELGDLSTPVILHWDLNHFVVLSAIRLGRYQIHDPAVGMSWITRAELSDHFTGIALELAPAPGFRQVDVRRQLRFMDLWSNSSGLRTLFFYSVLLTIIIQCLSLVLPYFMQIAIDLVLPTFDLRLLSILTLAFILVTVLNSTASLLRSFTLLSAGNSVASDIATNIARHLMRLPSAWFARRQLGDILSRFTSITPIKDALTENAITVVFDGLFALATLIVLLCYNFLLGSLAMLSMTSYGILRLVMRGHQRKVVDSAIVSAAEEQSHLMDSIRGITALRLFHVEDARLTDWKRLLVTAMNDGAQVQRVRLIQTVGSTFIVGIESLLSFWIAIKLVMSGELSLGMLFAFVSYKTQFISRGISATDQIFNFVLLRLHFDRISDIVFSSIDRSYSEPYRPDRTLYGSLELSNVGYRYSETDAVILNNVNLRIAPGEHIVIVGPSGAGKSTLVKILCGLIEPTEGMVLVDGVPIEEFGLVNYHRQIAVVQQADSLFSGSICANISMFDVDPDMGRVVGAAKAACIHDDINRMPLRYDTWVGNMGSTLSGGQQQRVLLARALYKGPKVLVLDEGTSHLDVELERRITTTISSMGITRIVVAHRPETISAAGRVYRLDQSSLSMSA